MIEPTLQVILDEMRGGFRAVNERLDRLNGQVRRHGEQIAVLEAQSSVAALTAKETSHQLDLMSDQFISHRARCPFDTAVQMTSDRVTPNDQAVLDLARRIRRNRLAVAAGVGGGAVLAVVELLPRLLEWVLAAQ